MVGIDEKGVVVACDQCGQKNRVAFDRLHDAVRCGKCKATIPAVHEPVEIPTTAAFGELIRSSPLPVLMDFWAPWCGPCKMVAPELHQVASHKAGEAIVAKVNTEELPALAQQYGISSIPALIIFVNGREAARTAGARPAAAIEGFLAQATTAAA